MSIIGLDRGLNPPEPPTRGECDGCGERFDYGDMLTIGWKSYCKECQNWMIAENEAERSSE